MTVMDTITIANREIALMAFDRLRKEDKKDSALKLARCMLQNASISLGIGDIDWDIDMAIRQCGGVQEQDTDTRLISTSTGIRKWQRKYMTRS